MDRLDTGKIERAAAFLPVGNFFLATKLLNHQLFTVAIGPTKK